MTDGYRVSLKFDPHHNEYEVQVFRNGKKDSKKSYFTDEKLDAVQTMNHMKKELGITG